MIATTTATATVMATATVTETVAVRLGELEFPKSGYAGTVVITIPAVATTKVFGGEGTGGEGLRTEGTDIYGDGGDVVGFVPAARG